MEDLIRARYGALPFAPVEIPPALAPILDRRVTRRYRPDPVPDALLDTVLAGAQSAPSKSDLQQYSIIVTRDPAKIAAVAFAIGSMDWIKDAPVLLLFCGDIRRGTGGPTPMTAWIPSSMPARMRHSRSASASWRPRRWAWAPARSPMCATTCR
jgi:nitroreductase